MIFLGDGKYQNVKLGRVTLIIALVQMKHQTLFQREIMFTEIAKIN